MLAELLSEAPSLRFLRPILPNVRSMIPERPFEILRTTVRTSPERLLNLVRR